MFRFIKQIFISALMYFGNLSSVNSLECVSMKNQECKVRPEIVNINSNNPIFYPFSIKVNECNGNCNNINDPYARVCVPNTVKDLNVKVFNLMTLTNETRHIKWHESCKCICRLDKRFIWNPSNCECECGKSCNIGKYLDYSNCKCRKELVDPLVDECAQKIEETKLVNITVENENKDRCSFSTVYRILIWIFFIFFIISCGIIIYFVYHKS